MVGSSVNKQISAPGVSGDRVARLKMTYQRADETYDRVNGLQTKYCRLGAKAMYTFIVVITRYCKMEDN